MTPLVLAQVQPPLPPPQDIQAGPGGLLYTALAIAGGVLALLLLLWLVRRALRRKPALAPPPEQPALPTEAPRIKVELPPSELEAQRRLEAERAKQAADELEGQRRRLAQEAKAAEDRAQRERLEAQARALKEQEEEAKRAEYRAKKAVEQEEKERRKKEAEEAKRLEAEAAQKAKQAEEAARAAALEEERRRIEAQAGLTLAQGLDKTRTQGFVAKLSSFFGAEPKKVDEAVLGQLEEILFSADIGVRTASSLVETAREKAKRNELASADRIKGVLRKEVERIVDLDRPKSLAGGGPPHVVMVVGVNGSGKTTTIGKLAAKLTAQGKTVVLAAGDTFRAAAAEQLDVWAERAGATLVKGKEDADPASVVFDGIKRALEQKADVVLADTAGRLHTKTPLMEELKKVKRVMDKALPGAPHEVLLVLDSTTGQNAIAQAKQFHEAVGVSAIALTKLDGTAKGGVVIGICDELKLPVAWVGIGEKVADLRPFEPKEFVAALFD